MSFTAIHDPTKNSLAEGYWFLFFRDRLVVSRNGDGGFTVPRPSGNAASPESTAPSGNAASPESAARSGNATPPENRIPPGNEAPAESAARPGNATPQENRVPPGNATPPENRVPPESAAPQVDPGSPENPGAAELAALRGKISRVLYFGRLDGVDCYAGDLASDDGLPDGFTADSLRPLYGKIPPSQMIPARFAGHLLHWDRSTRFCGSCGAPNRDKEDERAKVCSSCGALTYPRLSPAIIVAILDGKRILLAHNRRFATPFYSLIAGFVEMGETLEDCVAREVEEEVGVRVRNIRYFGSQPWPFPDSLMLGFIADYDGGEIRVDRRELLDARWFTPDNLPSLPAGDSIARRILTWYEKDYAPGLGPKGA